MKRSPYVIVPEILVAAEMSEHNEDSPSAIKPDIHEYSTSDIVYMRSREKKL